MTWQKYVNSVKDEEIPSATELLNSFSYNALNSYRSVIGSIADDNNFDLTNHFWRLFKTLAKLHHTPEFSYLTILDIYPRNQEFDLVEHLIRLRKAKHLHPGVLADCYMVLYKLMFYANDPDGLTILKEFLDEEDHPEQVSE